jgi:hypothetical protein
MCPEQAPDSVSACAFLRNHSRPARPGSGRAVFEGVCGRIASQVPQRPRHLHSCWHGPRLGHRLPFGSPRVAQHFGTHAFSFPPVKGGSLLIEPVLECSYSGKNRQFGPRTPARLRICNRPCERFENEPVGPDLFQVSGVVLRRGCRRCGSKDSFRIPTPH